MNKENLTMITLFSGTGMQERGFENSELFDLKVIGTSEIDADATLSYAAVHCDLTPEMIETYDYPDVEEMAQYLTDRRVGWDFLKNKGKDWFTYTKGKKLEDLKKYYLASVLQNNYGDISRIKELPYADFWTYSFPCTDISIAGKQEGLDTTCNDCGNKFNPMTLPPEERHVCPNCGSTNIQGTRSGLLAEVERLLTLAVQNKTSPKYLLLENVKNLVGKANKPDFDAWLHRLSDLGYNTYYEVLNAKHCGIPQNRERVFALSIRKDIDKKTMTFPLPFDNGLRLKDILEKDVEEKYYINTDRASNLIRQLIDKGQLKGQRECADSTINDPSTRDISNCITARYDASIQNQKQIGLVVCEPNVEQKRLGGMFDDKKGKHQAGSVWDTDGLAPTLDTMQGGHRQPCVVEDTNVINQLGNYINQPGRDNPQRGRVYDKEYIAPTLNCMEGGNLQPCIVEDAKTTEPKPTWKPLGKTQYMVSSLGSIADTSTKQKVIPFEEDGEMKVKLNINGVERVSTVKALVEKLFPNTDNDPQFLIGSTQKNAYVGDGSISSTLTSAMGEGGGHVPMIGFENTSKPICVGNTTPSGKSQCNAVYSTDGVSQTLCAGTHGYATGNILEEKTLVKIKQATKQGYIECEVPGVADLSYPSSTTRRGRVQDNGKTCPTITATETGVHYIENLYRIRKLMPSECWVLMGLTKEDCMKAANLGISNSALYKIAGNGIVTNCIKLIAEHLYKAQYDSTYICTDENFQKPQVD